MAVAAAALPEQEGPDLQVSAQGEPIGWADRTTEQPMRTQWPEGCRRGRRPCQS